MRSEHEVAIVTGVSSGIGAATAEALAGRGFHVFGTVRSAGTAVPAGVVPLVVDVRSEEDVDEAVRGVLRVAGRIDVLVNNAGVALVGAVEETSLAAARALFDTNVFGAQRMTRAVLPAMRARRRGRVVFVSSVAGFLPTPYMGVYAASKHALEALAESLDHEVRTLGIRAVLVEPGFTRTRLDANAGAADPPLADYAPARARAAAVIEGSVARGDDPRLVAAAVVRAATAERPRLRYPVGKAAGWLAVLRRLFPAALLDGGLRRQFRLDG